MLNKTILTLVIFVLSISLLSGCGKSTGNSASSNTNATKANTATEPATSKLEEKAEVTQVLDWFAQPTHAGFYAGIQQGFYQEANIDITVQAGGPQVSGIQIVASGKANFGVESAENILLAREKGIPIVGLVATMQKSPGAFFFHKEEPISTITDLNDHVVYATITGPFWEFMKYKFDLSKVKEMQFNGTYTNFAEDPKSVIQGYVTNAPYNLKQQGIDVDYIAWDSVGYLSYDSVIFTTEKFLEEHPETVQAYVQATLKGLEYNKEHGEEVNKKIKDVNNAYTLEALNYESKALQPYIYDGDAASNGVGYMTLEKWTAIKQQLLDAKVLKKDIDVAQAFTTEFLPKK